MARESASAGATPIGTLAARETVVVQGTISMLTLNPRSESAWLEAELRDGTGTITLVWMGHRAIPGIAPGAKLRAKGCVASHDGRPAIFNPAYELIA